MEIILRTYSKWRNVHSRKSTKYAISQSVPFEPQPPNHAPSTAPCSGNATLGPPLGIQSQED